MAESRHNKMYKNSPRLERGEDGGMKAVKGPPAADKENEGLAGNPLEGTPGELTLHHKHSSDRREMHHRHAHEHLAMHHRHEMEHSHHEMAGSTDKSEVHKRHETEHEEMTSRHHDELKALHKRHMTEHGGQTNKKEVHDQTSKESDEYRKP